MNQAKMNEGKDLKILGVFFCGGWCTTVPCTFIQNSVTIPANASILSYRTPQILLMEEILHQFIGSVSHYLQGFIHPRWLFGISAHQQ